MGILSAAERWRYSRSAAFSRSQTSVGLPRLQADLLRPLARCKNFGLKIQPLARQGA